MNQLNLRGLLSGFAGILKNAALLNVLKEQEKTIHYSFRPHMAHPILLQYGTAEQSNNNRSQPLQSKF